MTYVSNGDGWIDTDLVSPGEIECCAMCMLFARHEPDMAIDLKFMQLRHVDHTLSPELYLGWKELLDNPAGVC